MADTVKLTGGSPVQSEVLVNSDPDCCEGDGSISHPLRVTSTLGPRSKGVGISPGTGLSVGMPFYIDSSGLAQPAKGDSLVHATAVGIVTTAQVIPDRDTGRGVIDYAILGVITQTPATWNGLTGGSSGLTPGATYYVDASTAGHLTTMAPSGGGQFVTKVGVAISSTALLVQFGTPVAASGG